MGCSSSIVVSTLQNMSRTLFQENAQKNGRYATGVWYYQSHTTKYGESFNKFFYGFLNKWNINLWINQSHRLCWEQMPQGLRVHQKKYSWWFPILRFPTGLILRAAWFPLYRGKEYHMNQILPWFDIKRLYKTKM